MLRPEPACLLIFVPKTYILSIMGQRKTILYYLATAVIILLASCSAPRNIVFADREWHVSDYYGQIIDKDTTYRMTFGNVLIPAPLIIISSADSVTKYPGMECFIADILHTTHLDSAEILFYAPEMQTMFVRLTKQMPPLRPSSISSPMTEENPNTLILQEDDIDEWVRKSGEMYSYIYYDRKKRQLLIVDCYDYGDTPIAQITVFQSKNKITSKMKVPENHRRFFYEIHDLKDYTRYYYCPLNHKRVSPTS